MSSSTNPISAERFAAALEDLPVSALHAKAAEIQNSLNHLVSSNEQLAPFAAEGDTDCADAIRENEIVMDRFKERIGLLKAEVEGRGLPWTEQAMREGPTINGATNEAEAEPNANGHSEDNVVRGETSQVITTQSGTLTDEELATRIQQRLQDDEDDGGMHL